MNEPSQLSHFLEAYEKNESQSHCLGAGRGERCREKLCWEKWFLLLQGTREPLFGKYAFSRQSCSLPHALLCTSPTGQTARRDAGIKAQSPPRSCFQHPQFPGNHQPPQNTFAVINVDSQTRGKGILNPPRGTLIWTYLTLQKKCPGVRGLIHLAHTYWTPTVCQALF